MDQSNPKHKYRLVGEWIRSSPEEEDLGVLADEKINTTWQCTLTAQKANRPYPGLHQKQRGQQAEGGDSAPLLHSSETPPGVLHPAGPVGAGPEEATKMVRVLKNLSYEERLRELGLFSLEKRKLWEDLREAFQYLEGAYKKAREGLFTRAQSDRTRRNGFKLKEGRFRLDRKKKLFTTRVVRHWNRLPREAVDAPSLEAFKARLDGA